MPNLIDLPEELRGRVGVTSLVSVFSDLSRAPHVFLLSRRGDYREMALGACFAVGYDAQRAHVVADVLGRDGRASLVHDDGSLYCTLFPRSMEVVR